MRFLADWRFWLYNLATLLYFPVLLLRKWRRRRQKGVEADWEFDPLRWICPVYQGSNAAGGENEKPQSAPHVVFISSGFGEMRAIEQLSLALQQRRPDVRTTWALRRRATLRIIQEEHPDQDVAFMPFDFFIPTWNWARRLSPDVVVSVEKLFLPNVIWCSVNRGARVLVVNGRSGRRRSKRLKSIVEPLVQRWSLAGFDLICLQSARELENIKRLLPPKAQVRVTGSTKFENLHVEQAQASSELRQWLGDDSSPLLLGGSTHLGEEELVLKAWKEVRRHAACRLLIAPRHPHEVEELISVLRREGFENFSRRSEYSLATPHAASGPAASAEILVLDTLGELAGVYQLAAAAYVGGTLHGPGHNVIEPLAAGIPVFFGPGKGEPTPIQLLCMAADVGFRVDNDDELAKCWLEILQNPASQSETGLKIKRFLQEQQGAVENNVAAILEVLEQAELGLASRNRH